MVQLPYSVESEYLLDGTAGQILAMNVLPKYSLVNPQLRPGVLAPTLNKITLIALSSKLSSFVQFCVCCGCGTGCQRLVMLGATLTRAHRVQS
jgi:hypothetical protein